MKHFYDLQPTLVLYYDRLAYTGRDSSLRITFDTNICYRDHHFSLSPTGQDTYLMDQRNYLMEVKVMGGMPLWLSHLLTHHQIYPISYSKYVMTLQEKSALREATARPRRLHSYITSTFVPFMTHPAAGFIVGACTKLASVS